jgi:hypothetical protein
MYSATEKKSTLLLEATGWSSRLATDLSEFAVAGDLGDQRFGVRTIH